MVGKICEKVLNCIYNIPICGGFCAPTVSPEEGWIRHFSNEYTVPGSGIYMLVGRCCETSWFCRFLGSCGVPCARKNRRRLMLTAFAVSFFSWILLIYPVLALSTRESMIMFAAWAKGTSYDSDGLGPVKIYIGLKGRVDRIDCNQALDPSKCMGIMNAGKDTARVPFVDKGDGIFSRVVVWSSDLSCPSIAGPLMNTTGTYRHEMCEKCRKSVASTVSFAIMGVITQIPQMTTDLQRSTVFGDVNCQATMGFLTSVWGCFSALMSLRSFSFGCWRAFPRHFPNQPFDIQWYGGTAFWCLLAASVLKIWDAVSHILLPTPTARHKPHGPHIKTVADYMMMAVDAKGNSSSEDDEEGSTENTEEVSTEEA